MKFASALLAACVFLSASSLMHADSISFSSDLLGGQVAFNGTGSAYGLHIPIQSLNSGGKTVPVTAGNSGAGLLQFVTGSVISASAGQDEFAQGGTLRIIGMVPGDSQNVTLLTAMFIGPVDVINTEGGQLLLSGNIEVTAVDTSVSALFPGITIPSDGSTATRALLGIHGQMGPNGSFFGKAQAQSLTTTPEPSAMILFGSGLLGLAGILKRKKGHSK